MDCCTRYLITRIIEGSLKMYIMIALPVSQNMRPFVNTVILMTTKYAAQVGACGNTETSRPSLDFGLLCL